MAARASAGTSHLTILPSPGRLASSTVGSAQTSWPRCWRAGAVASRPTCPRTTGDEIATPRAMSRLYHVALEQRPPRRDALVAEPRQVDRPEGAVHDQLGDRASGSGGLLHAVPGEAVGEVEVAETGVPADDRVLIERVVVVVAGPGVHHLDALERRHALCQLR